jgi:hypothetical protein
VPDTGETEVSEQVPSKELIAAPENPTLEDLIAFYGDSNFRSGVKVRIPYAATRQVLEELRQMREDWKTISEAADAMPSHEPPPLDAHPEAFCEECQRPNGVWFAPSEIWNIACSENGVLCPVCFITKTEKAGIKPTSWMIAPEGYSAHEPPAEQPSSPSDLQLWAGWLQRELREQLPHRKAIEIHHSDISKLIEVLRAAPPPPVDRVLALLSGVDAHLANAKWEEGGTVRKRLREAADLLRPSSTKEVFPEWTVSSLPCDPGKRPTSGEEVK